jgi:hypothetical protein
MEKEPSIRLIGLFVQVIDSGGIERGGATFDAVDLVFLVQQILGQVGAVLTRDPGYQRFLWHVTLWYDW